MVMAGLFNSSIRQKVRIQIPNPFNYGSRKDFLPQLKGDMANFDLILDFSGVDILDSSALGMLLLAREKVKGTKGKISGDA
jgi:hypothetical protein